LLLEKGREKGMKVRRKDPDAVKGGQILPGLAYHQMVAS
jgi:hypothetical protein